MSASVIVLLVVGLVLLLVVAVLVAALVATVVVRRAQRPAEHSGDPGAGHRGEGVGAAGAGGIGARGGGVAVGTSVTGTGAALAGPSGSSAAPVGPAFTAASPAGTPGAPAADPGVARTLDLLDAQHPRHEGALAAPRVPAEGPSSRVEHSGAEAAAARAEAASAGAEAASARAEARRLLDDARRAADGITERARAHAQAEVADALVAARRSGEREAEVLTESARRVGAEVDRREARLAEREERLDAEQHRLEQRDRDLAAREAALAARDAEVAALEDARQDELARVAGLTADAAKAELIHTIETQAKREAALRVRDIEAEARETGEARARGIVVDAIQRVASEQTAESVVTVLHLPADEMKGRIIGREGRNIRTFESVTGVNLIIDDTPEAVLLSCFDPVRREIGRLTLEKLVLDGRIHPHRIEEVYEQSRAQVEQLCVRAGEDALVEVGITDVHPELVALLGRLRYRTSYGQNVLKHLVETAHIAGMMASELGIDPTVLKRGAFLHDIGKALTHEVEGSHALIGADLARRYGEDEQVVHAIEAHHNEVQPQTVEAVLTQAADACSGGRPGARRESLETYVKRLERIEEIAATRPGVEKVFAMQAGREVRVMVSPDDVDDLGAQVLARDVAKQIEDELTYPGQIRVTV
ncbi:MAG TPA: ribonuclease Y, partial [Mycobacteriales bacterium]|nr:ribonuclease Y [Mycobacteriales bacterium]